MARFDTGERYDTGRHYDVVNLLPQIRTSMKRPKLLLKTLSVSDLGVIGARIQAAMSTNAATFPNSAADVTALEGELDDLNTAIAEAETARVIASVKLAARETASSAVEARLSKLSGQVHDVAQGVVETIHLAGMDATNDPQPVLMTQVENLKIKPSDQDAELLASWKAVPGASYNRVQISTDATPGNWKDHLMTTKSKCKLNHTLVSGTKVYVRVCAGNANGEGPWSDIGWKTVP
jgi:hypothetical protein